MCTNGGGMPGSAGEALSAMGTILVGMATVDEFEASVAAVQKGPLPAAALARLAELRAGFAGETR